MQATSNQHTHEVGVRYVRERLEARGFWVWPSPSNIATIDLTAMARDGSTYGIKVRVNTSGDTSWVMKDWSEGSTGENLMFCLVSIYEDLPAATPDVYVVPGAVVADHISVRHSVWLKGPKANGEPRTDSDVRVLSDPIPDSVWSALSGAYPDGWLDQYREAWTTIKF